MLHITQDIFIFS